MKKILLFFIVLAVTLLLTSVKEINATNLSGSTTSDRDSISIYPNPNDGRFDITIFPLLDIEQTFSVIIYNMLGTKVFEKELKTRNGTISVNAQPVKNGLYHMVIKKENWVRTKRILIK